jgi:nicotinic acid mononucleotide adenylyltransferase
MGKDRFLPVIAVVILAIASISSVYVYATQTSTTSILINGQHYTIDQLFSFTKSRMFVDLNYSGIALDDLIIKTGVNNPDSNTYTIIGSDGYQKTVTWDNMKNGLLTKNRMVVFSDLPKAFRVKDVVTIEVK